MGNVYVAEAFIQFLVWNWNQSNRNIFTEVYLIVTRPTPTSQDSFSRFVHR
jgi:hypothetical protein